MNIHTIGCNRAKYGRELSVRISTSRVRSRPYGTVCKRRQYGTFVLIVILPLSLSEATDHESDVDITQLCKGLCLFRSVICPWSSTVSGAGRRAPFPSHYLLTPLFYFQNENDSLCTPDLLEKPAREPQWRSEVGHGQRSLDFVGKVFHRRNALPISPSCGSSQLEQSLLCALAHR